MSAALGVCVQDLTLHKYLAQNAPLLWRCPSFAAEFMDPFLEKTGIDGSAACFEALQVLKHALEAFLTSDDPTVVEMRECLLNESKAGARHQAGDGALPNPELATLNLPSHPLDLPPNHLRIAPSRITRRATAALRTLRTLPCASESWQAPSCLARGLATKASISRSARRSRR